MKDILHFWFLYSLSLVKISNQFPTHYYSKLYLHLKDTSLVPHWGRLKSLVPFYYDFPAGISHNHFKNKKWSKKNYPIFSESTAHSVFGVLPFNIWTSLKLKFNLVKCASLKQFWKLVRNNFLLAAYFYILTFVL